VHRFASSDDVVAVGAAPKLIGSILTGWIISAGSPRTALLVGSGAFLAAALVDAFVPTLPNPDQALTDLGR
jgi:hypothetical protein